MAAVSIEQVRKSYGAVEVIPGASIEIEDGEFLVLVGPSGCGKSTLLRMIAGLEDITEGTISIGGNVVNDVAPKDRDIAMVFQNYALYPHMTVAQNMSFSLRLAKVEKPKIREAVNAAAEILGLQTLLDRYPGQLSGGQRQRVAMGRAIVRNPKVFLFDEPLSNLDAKLRIQVRAEIKELHQRLKTTTVYVTHDQTEAMTMADRIVVLREGVVEQIGSPLELYDSPANVFVAGFIGSPAMNFITGHISGGAFVAPGNIDIPLPVSLQLEENRGVVCGMRPYNVELSESGIAAEVIVVEPTGSETQLIVRVADTQITCISRERLSVRAGDMIHFSLNPVDLLMFDLETELPLSIQ
jgi:multiple sugar transport system ATP-binding protein